MRYELKIEKRYGLPAAVAVWACAVVAGLFILAEYSNQAGISSEPPEELPSAESVADGRYRCVVFVHPHCPCTAASLRELERVVSQCQNSLETTIYFYCPDEEPSEWVHGALWSAAQSLPYTTVEVDRGGGIAKQYHSSTSGDVLLYSPTGQLCFHGGITPSRGHEGDNRGKSAVLSVVLGSDTAGNEKHANDSPVFGCSLRSAPSSNAN